MCQTCNQEHLHNNSITVSLRSDPTRTLSIQRNFEREVVKRFTILKNAIVDAVEKKNIFGINRLKTQADELMPEQFQFMSNAHKIDAFMKWINEMEEKHILTSEIRPGLYGGNQPWTNMYLQSAYQRGISRARAELNKAGWNVPSAQGYDPMGRSAIGIAFNQPINADAVAIIYTRAYNELQGITDAMDQQISRVLAQGLVDGLGIEALARNLVARVDSIGITRARTLARTEVVSAHHQATINEYEQWGVLGVSVEAEWLTAGFGVCPECASNAGKVFTLAEIRSMIPAHPNCRCVALPIRKGQELPTAPVAKQFTEEDLNRIFKNPGDTEEIQQKQQDIQDALWSDLKNSSDFVSNMLETVTTEFKDFLGSKPEEFIGKSVIQINSNNWSSTSGDSNKYALMMQQAAMEEFGLKDATLSHLPMEMIDSQNAIKANRALLRAQYNNTQDFLKKQGITEIHLYRGMYVETEMPNGTTVLKMQPLSSFTSNKSIAEMFATSKSGKSNIVIDEVIPASRILGTTMTGFGCTNEFEFVILGGIDTANVQQAGGF
jgi:SPP1 gp7 family putative phage head morphogenesis protein